MAIIRGNYTDFFFEEALPALNAVLWQNFRQKPMLYSRLFKIENSNRSIEQFTTVSGVGLLTEISETGEVRLDQPVQGYHSTFVHRKYGLGIEHSKELFDDDRWGIIREATAELGKSANETIEIDAASTFNNAFSVSHPGPDGVPLCASNHPLWKSGGVQSNVLSVPADLDVTSLELALTDWETMRKANGHQVSLPTPRLLVAPANRWNAHEILKGTMRSDTANNTINAFRYGEHGPISDILVWSKLTDPDAWFLVAPPEDTGLLWIWRKRPYNKGFWDERKEAGGQIVRYRKAHGWTHFWGVYGSPGA